MKTIMMIFLLTSKVVAASAIPLQLETKAAQLSDCSLTQPCLVTLEDRDGKHVVKVQKSVIITEHGVLKFTAGSIVYYVFDPKGNLIKKVLTP